MEKLNTTVGTKIKNFRESKNISREELAERAGLDVRFIEFLEENREIPSIGDLIKVARVLGVRLGTFLDDQTDQGPVVSRAEEYDKAPSLRSRCSENSEMSYFSLSQNKQNRHLETYMVELQPAAGEKHFSSHEGEEFLYVVEGEAEVVYGRQSYLLKKGDTIYYDSVVPHYIGSASAEKAAKVLAVIYIPV